MSKNKLKKFADQTILLPTANSVQMGDIVNADQLSFMFFNHLLHAYIIERNRTE